MTTEALSYLVVFEDDGSQFWAQPHEASSIDAGVERWISSNRTIDTVLWLDLLNGGRYRILASLIRSWLLTTPEIRAKQRELDAALKAEEPDIPEWQKGEDA